MSFPSMRTQPCTAGQAPTKARASEDLPEPDCPTMATISPGASRKETSATAGICDPGTRTVTASTEISPDRGGNRVGRLLCRPRSEGRRRAAHTMFAPTTSAFHCETAASTGASARPMIK